MHQPARPSPQFPLDPERRQYRATAETLLAGDGPRLRPHVVDKELWERSGLVELPSGERACLFCAFADSKLLAQFCRDNLGDWRAADCDNALYSGLLYLSPLKAKRAVASDHVFVFPVFKPGQHVRTLEDLRKKVRDGLIARRDAEELLRHMYAVAWWYLTGEEPGEDQDRRVDAAGRVGRVAFHSPPSVMHLHVHASGGEGSVVKRKKWWGRRVVRLTPRHLVIHM